ncbi:hypothetical protein [Spartinivicinus ruber]|uniref:hypothetical protein n=1 Tax=Spartinivicinus ruber TaxID=2683272 RepID=UPI0013D728FF|nr:hypothetical protein [Spartinivicinus ruber]
MLTITRRVGESVRVGEHRIVLRGRRYGFAELSIFHQGKLQIKQIDFGKKLNINDAISLTAMPHIAGIRDSLSQVDLFIQAPLSIKIERDELEAGIKTKRRKPQYIGVMS